MPLLVVVDSHQGVPAVFVDVEQTLRRLVAHTLANIGLDDPHAMEFVAARLGRDRIIRRDFFHLGRRVVGAESVVGHQQLLLADQFPVEAVQRTEEHVRLIDGVLIVHADLWGIVRI
ncbi:hypothetical protein D9M69_634020 [compost metagenome]